MGAVAGGVAESETGIGIGIGIATASGAGAVVSQTEASSGRPTIAERYACSSQRRITKDDVRSPRIISSTGAVHPDRLQCAPTIDMIRKVVLLGLLVCPACATAEGSLGPDGGVARTPDGVVTLFVPEGALDEEIDVALVPVDDGPEGSIGPTVAIAPDREPLARPATVFFETEGLDLGMRPVLVGRRGNLWLPLADRDFDLDTGVLSGRLTYFSVVAALGSAAEP